MSDISRACGGGDGGRPLVPGSLRGYRTWRPSGRRRPVPRGMLPLTSVTRRRIFWAPSLTAHCTPPDIGTASAWAQTVPGDHHAPLSGCNCGIYAWYDPKDSRMLNTSVFGVVEASGLVLMGERGFRAGRARITAIATRNRRVAEACAEAGVPTYRRRRDLLRHYPPEDPSSLLDDGSEPEARRSPSPTRWLNGFDRALFLAIWVRTGLIALAAAVLPVAAAVIIAVMAELVLVLMIVMRMR